MSINFVVTTVSHIRLQSFSPIQTRLQWNQLLPPQKIIFGCNRRATTNQSTPASLQHWRRGRISTQFYFPLSTFYHLRRNQSRLESEACLDGFCRRWFNPKKGKNHHSNIFKHSRGRRNHHLIPHPTLLNTRQFKTPLPYSIRVVGRRIEQKLRYGTKTAWNQAAIFRKDCFSFLSAFPILKCLCA